MLNLGKISSNIFFAMILEVSFLVGKVLLNLKKMSIKTDRYLLLYLADFTSVKSNFQYVSGQLQLSHLPGVFLLCPVLMRTQDWHLFALS
jgi:predicted CDP-diglyceride synthetase/phosphatidate cytidylyltransferase